jgi:hypothetical protein
LTSYFMWDTSIYQHQALWTGPTLNPCGLSTVPHVCWLNPHVRWSKRCRFFLCKIILWLLVESCCLCSWKISAIRTTVLGLVQCLFNTIHYVSFVIKWGLQIQVSWRLSFGHGIKGTSQQLG